jgi:ABC-type antimicrobial peptide transport system permease subunit
MSVNNHAADLSVFVSDFWITTSSININYIPQTLEYNDEGMNRKAYYYKDNPVNLSKDATNLGYTFLPLGLGVRCEALEDIKHTCLVEFETFDDAFNAKSVIESLMLNSLIDESFDVDDKYMVSSFKIYSLFYEIFNYASIVLFIFGGVIFFTTLLNLYNTIHYSVQSKKNYIGMMRAVGMKDKEVMLLYFVEVLEVFIRSYLWSALFGGLICGSICYFFGSLMDNKYAKLIVIDLSLDPIYILVAFLILVTINTIISVVFALASTYKVSTTPILEILGEKE